jgi:hypothetical protein
MLRATSSTLVGLDDVAVLDVLEVLQPDPALVAVADLADVSP